MFGRLSRAIVPLASGLVALVLGHSLVYLARYGSTYGEALAHEGHDLAWTIAVWSTGVIAAGLAIAGIVRLLWLGRAAARAGSRSPGWPSDPSRERVRAWLLGWLVAGVRLAIVTGLALTIQENAEHVAAGLPLQGPLMLLRADYPFGFAIVLATSLAVSLVVRLYLRRRDQLLARLHAARTAHAPARHVRLPVRTALPASSILGRVGALRAPPVLLAS